MQLEANTKKVIFKIQSLTAVRITEFVRACTVKATQGRVSVKIKVQQLYGVKHLAKVVVLNLYKLGSL